MLKLTNIITSILSLLFSLSFGIVIKLQQETKLRKKKHKKLLHLAKNKLANDSIDVQAKNKLRTNCTIPDKRFVLSVHYNATDDNGESFLFINGVEQYKFKADKNEIVPRKLDLGSIPDNSVLHYSLTMNGNIYSFALDYELTRTDKIQKIHKYLMKKHNI